jgi:hypothetical protein
MRLGRSNIVGAWWPQTVYDEASAVTVKGKAG